MDDISPAHRGGYRCLSGCEATCGLLETIAHGLRCSIGDVQDSFRPAKLARNLGRLVVRYCTGEWDCFDRAHSLSRKTSAAPGNSRAGIEGLKGMASAARSFHEHCPRSQY